MSDLRVVVEMAGDEAAGHGRVLGLLVRDDAGRVIPCSGVIWTGPATDVPIPGVVLWRSELDFGGAEEQVASQLLSVLAAIHRRFMARGAPGAADPPGRISLTPREHTMLEMLSQGLTADAIARRLRITVKTVRKHLEHIYRKLGVHDRLLAVERARSEGLLASWAPAARTSVR